MQTKKFQRKTEQFVCENCGKKTIGNGYTDHCPICLWSKHVDINPGDRAEQCKGMMEPIGYEPSSRYVYFRCTRCRKMHRVKTSENDNASLLAELAQMPISIKNSC
jgi:hypothetical protein